MKAPPYSYINLQDKALIEEHSESKAYWPLRPSSAGKCETRLGYDMLQYDGLLPFKVEDREPNVIRLLKLGHSIEFAMIRDFNALKKYDIGLRYKQQVVTIGDIKLKDGTKRIIEGSIDFALVSEEHNFKTVADAKSSKDAFHVSYKTRWEEEWAKMCDMESTTVLPPIDGHDYPSLGLYIEDLEAFLSELGTHFKEDNFLQLNCYANSEFFKSRGFDNCSLFYYNKNDSREYELRFKPCAKLAKMVIKKFQKAALAEDPLKDCKRTYALGSIKCAWCPYNDKCWDTDARKAYFNTYPKKKWPTKIAQVKDQSIHNLFEVYETEKQREKIEKEICAILDNEKVRKIELDDGRVFEMKALKKGLVLRESKK